MGAQNRGRKVLLLVFVLAVAVACIPGAEPFQYDPDKYIVTREGDVVTVTHRERPTRQTTLGLLSNSRAKPLPLLPHVTPNFTGQRPTPALDCNRDTRTIVPLQLMQQFPFNAVGKVIFIASSSTGMSGTYTCTAYLISPKVLRTAAHCVASPEYSFTGGIVQFGVSEGKQVGLTVNICSWSSYKQYRVSEDFVYDHGEYLLCDPVHVAQYFAPVALDLEQGYKRRVPVTTLGYPGDSNSLMRSDSACTLAVSKFCDVDVLYCPNTIKGGMSGGPTINALTGHVVATTSFTCAWGCGSGLVTHTKPTEVGGLTFF